MAAVCAAGCAEPPPEKYSPSTPPDRFPPLSAWVDDPKLANTFTQACKLWDPKGISCVMTQDPAEANLIVESNGDDSCEQAYEKMGHDALADTAYELRKFGNTPLDTATIRFNSKCIKELEMDDIHIMAHEIGHSLGIDWHIPLNIEDVDPTYPRIEEIRTTTTGRLVVGRAIMSTYGSDLRYITEPDSDAFDLRSEGVSILPPSTTQCSVDKIDLSGKDPFIHPVTIVGDALWYSINYDFGSEGVDGVTTNYIQVGSDNFYFPPGILIVQPAKIGEEASVSGLPPEATCQLGWFRGDLAFDNAWLFDNICEIGNPTLPNCTLPAGSPDNNSIIVSYELK